MARTSPVLLREEIGRSLRAAREAAGFSLDDAAKKLDLSKSSLSRIELGKQRATVHVVRSMMDLYRFATDDLLDKVRVAKRPGWWQFHGISDTDFIAMESGASRMCTYTVQFVHGLLQTADYARAVFESGREVRSDAWIADELEVRLIRQDRLTDEDHPLELVAVVDELALRRPVGGRAVMRAQLRHLALVAELPTVTLHVLPSTVVSNDAMKGAFMVLDFPDDTHPPITFLETALGDERKDKAAIVHATRLQFEHLRSLALDPEQSVALIERVSDELWSG